MTDNLEVQHLPILDYSLGIKLAGNKKDLAQDMLALLIQALPKDLAAINQLYQEKKHPELRQNLHRLHGALCYCGVPRLKTIVAHLESDLKNNIMSSLSSLLNQLDAEVRLLLEHYGNQSNSQY